MSEVDEMGRVAILKQIEEKQEMKFFLNTKSPKKHYHRVQELEKDIMRLKQQLESKDQSHN